MGERAITQAPSTRQEWVDVLTKAGVGPANLKKWLQAAGYDKTPVTTPITPTGTTTGPNYPTQISETTGLPTTPTGTTTPTEPTTPTGTSSDDILGVIEEAIKGYRPGGEFAKSREEQLAEKRATVIPQMQSQLVGRGLTGTTVGMAIPTTFEQEVAKPFQTETELLRSQRLMESIMAKAGIMQTQRAQDIQVQLAQQQMDLQKQLQTGQITSQEYLAKLDRTLQERLQTGQITSQEQQAALDRALQETLQKGLITSQERQAALDRISSGGGGGGGYGGGGVTGADVMGGGGGATGADVTGGGGGEWFPYPPGQGPANAPYIAGGPKLYQAGTPQDQVMRKYAEMANAWLSEPIGLQPKPITWTPTIGEQYAGLTGRIG